MTAHLRKRKEDQQYWSDLELRTELLCRLHGCSDLFRERLKQILMDMRLYHESLETLLSMISRLMPQADQPSKMIFLENVERIAFDIRLAPQYTTPLIAFLKEQRAS